MGDASACGLHGKGAPLNEEHPKEPCFLTGLGSDKELKRRLHCLDTAPPTGSPRRRHFLLDSLSYRPKREERPEQKPVSTGGNPFTIFRAMSDKKAGPDLSVWPQIDPEGRPMATPGPHLFCFQLGWVIPASLIL
jgi:hypothetical protein